MKYTKLMEKYNLGQRDEFEVVTEEQLLEAHIELMEANAEVMEDLHVIEMNKANATAGIIVESAMNNVDEATVEARIEAEIMEGFKDKLKVAGGKIKALIGKFVMFFRKWIARAGDAKKSMEEAVKAAKENKELNKENAAAVLAEGGMASLILFRAIGGVKEKDALEGVAQELLKLKNGEMATAVETLVKELGTADATINIGKVKAAIKAFLAAKQEITAEKVESVLTNMETTLSGMKQMKEIFTTIDAFGKASIGAIEKDADDKGTKLNMISSEIAALQFIAIMGSTGVKKTAKKLNKVAKGKGGKKEDKKEDKKEEEK